MALIGAGRGSDALWRNESREAGKTADNYQQRQSDVTRGRTSETLTAETLLRAQSS